MNNNVASTPQRRTTFSTDAERLMAVRAPRAYALMGQFSEQSQAFAGLRNKVIDMHFFTKDGEPLPAGQLSPEFCAKALTLLVERVIKTMEKDIYKAA